MRSAGRLLTHPASSRAGTVMAPHPPPCPNPAVHADLEIGGNRRSRRLGLEQNIAQHRSVLRVAGAPDD